MSDGEQIKIPKGFIFDGASIPRPLWILLSPVGLLFIQGLLHDYGYKYNRLELANPTDDNIYYGENYGKLFWDKVFLKEGIRVNDFALIGAMAWLALLAFGWIAWRKHRRNKK